MNDQTFGEFLTEFFDFLSRRYDDLIEVGLEHMALVSVSVLLSTVIGVIVGVTTYRTERPR
ncbi:MAG: hypothetical protein H0U22_02935, partial [Geodermatophilaceae bacterium]|nr:hypothetical protein [Geodermatophilaceae bacterium]